MLQNKQKSNGNTAIYMGTDSVKKIAGPRITQGIPLFQGAKVRARPVAHAEDHRRLRFGGVEEECARN
jgi:hypothetical protein